MVNAIRAHRPQKIQPYCRYDKKTKQWYMVGDAYYTDLECVKIRNKILSIVRSIRIKDQN